MLHECGDKSPTAVLLVVRWSEKDEARVANSASVHSWRVARAHALPAQISRTVLALTPNPGAMALQCTIEPRRNGPLSCGRSLKISSARTAVSCRG